MATIINISQGFATNEGTRSVNKIWRVVNTTLKDEQQLMLEAFLPITVYEENIEPHLNNMVDAAFHRFFDKGMFLLEEHFEALNDALDSINFKRVVLSNDSNYFQPTLPGKFKPCLQAWKNNGKARHKEMSKIYQEYKSGSISIEQYRVPKNIIAELIDETPEVKKTLKRVTETADKVLYLFEDRHEPVAL